MRVQGHTNQEEPRYTLRIPELEDAQRESGVGRPAKSTCCCGLRRLMRSHLRAIFGE